MSLASYRRGVRQGKREAIRRAAFRVFLAHGFQASSMAQIAQEAEVSTATLYKHGKSKEALFLSVTQAHIESFALSHEEVDFAPLSPLDALLEVSRGYIALMQDPETRALFRLIIMEGERFPELVDLVYRVGRDPVKQQLVAYLEAQSEAGVLIPIQDPSAAAEHYIGLLAYWLTFVPLFNRDIRFSAASVERRVRDTALMFLSPYVRPGVDLENGPKVARGAA